MLAWIEAKGLHSATRVGTGPPYLRHRARRMPPCRQSSCTQKVKHESQKSAIASDEKTSKSPMENETGSEWGGSSFGRKFSEPDCEVELNFMRGPR